MKNDEVEEVIPTSMVSCPPDGEIISGQSSLDGEANVDESDEVDDDGEEEKSIIEDTADWDPLDETTVSEKVAEFALPSHLRPIAGE